MKQLTCKEEGEKMLAILSQILNLHERNGRRIGAPSPAISLSVS